MGVRPAHRSRGRPDRPGGHHCDGRVAERHCFRSPRVARRRTAATVERWNAALAAGNDNEFSRFTPATPDSTACELRKGPFYAVQLFPMTRKSMGGLAIDANAQVRDTAGRPIPGLYAAGEVTGVAGINGSYGGEGTFLGPAVFLGRIAGAAAAGSRLKPRLREEDADSRSGFRCDRSRVLAGFDLGASQPTPAVVLHGCCQINGGNPEGGAEFGDVAGADGSGCNVEKLTLLGRHRHVNIAGYLWRDGFVHLPARHKARQIAWGDAEKLFSQSPLADACRRSNVLRTSSLPSE